MNAPPWHEVREDWDYEPDHAWRDAYVFSTTEDDWQRVLDLVHSRGWSFSYTEDGHAAPMPSDIQAIFERRRERAISWTIRPSSEIGINCHFFTPDEIEFDFDPREIVGPDQWDTVCEFIGPVGRTIQKPVAVCWENSPSAVIVRYDPSADAISRIVPEK